jgi:ABC-2 type transport system permease protein
VSTSFTGTRHLLRLVLRRDRVRLPVWLISVGGLIAVSALAVPPVYDTPEKIAGYARTVGTSAVSYLMSGRQVAIDTLGGIVANEISQVAQLGICLMVVFLVVRHTRAEEESGRAELLRSGVLGRHAATLAGLLYGVAAALVIGLVTTASMLAVDLDPVGSTTYGVGLTLLGICYVAVTLLAAQVSTSARGALGLAGAAIAVGYLVRGVGAMQDNALVWASPFGWAQEMNAFGSERWWPVLPLLVLTAGSLALAAWLTAHRDFGGGVLHTRPGRPHGSRLLGTPVGLALRLQRGLLTGWGVGLTALGLLYGAVVPTIPDLVASNPDIAKAIGASGDIESALVDAFLGYIFLFMAVLTTGFAVTSVLRLRAEEEAGRAEVVLATGVRRTAWVSATVLVAAVGASVLMVLMGLGLAVGYGLGTGDGGRIMRLVGDQLGYLPGVLLVAAVAVAVVGLVPRWSLLAWVGVAFVVLQVMLSETLRLPDWVDGISPFWHLARLPVETFDPGPVILELALAAGFVLLGLWSNRRRDIVAG